MKKVILKSMTDFVLEQYKSNYHTNTPIRILNYANFLIQILELWMFVPAKLLNGVWVVLEEPDLTCKRPENKGNCQCGEESVKDCREWWNEYQEAKDRVLFKGFKKSTVGSFDIQKDYSLYRFSDYIDIEGLIKNSHTIEIELTANAQKQIGI